uniref:RHS repeat domain-containing protein n=1 Tax=Acetivibrio cellulolyticus TaxID=35830 RepID=UPI0002481AB8
MLINTNVQMVYFQCKSTDNANKYKYDALNRLYEKTDPMNVAYEKLEYNARSLQDKSYDAYNRLTEYDYDCNGRLVSTTDPELHEASQEYDNMGNVRVKRDGEENEIKYEYDILGRLEHVYNDESETTPMSSYTYYIDGTLKEQNLGGYVTTYYYNASGKLKMVCDPNGIGVSSKTETYEYTPTGELMEKLDRNGKNTTYEYDCHGRMISQFTGDSSTYVQITVPNESTDMGYDGNGNLKKIIVETKENGVLQSRVTTQRIYDELNRVKTKTETSVDANNNTIVMGPVTYNYDIITGVNAGEVKEQSVYPGSNSVDKVYDAAGRLKTVTSDGQTTVYDYYDDGRRESITYNDNFRQVYTYYDDGLLDTLTNQVKDDQGVFAESEYYKYCYDGAHNMTQKQERLGGPTEPTETTSYAYDCMNRLKNIYEPDINTAQRTIAYTYDSRGNRDTEIETITATNEVTYTKYEYTDNNRIQYVTKREDDQYGNIIQKRLYLHDSNGNLKNVYDITNGPSTITTNTYTLLNQLKTTVTTGINQQMENTYNAEGKRVAKTVDGTTARYFYEYDNVVFEYTNSGAISAFNVIGTNLISRETGTDKVYYFYNGHADVTALLDATTKSIRSQYKYDEFGNITSETYYDSTGEETIDENEIIKSQILYAGYQYDEESKYYNLQARYYDPQTARFLQQDTYMGSANDPLSLNLYAYCHNEPMMYVDPTGYTGEKSALTLVNGIIAAKRM